jgi:hypothetical protein
MFDVYVINGDSLMVARPKGILDAAEALRIVEFVEIREAQIETGFNRFCDLTQVDGIHLLSADLGSLAVRRREFNPNSVHVKSAFFATDPLAFGIARMYELLLNSPRIEVEVFKDMQAAADWLGVKVDRLTL